jgi:hypothetical protein
MNAVFKSFKNYYKSNVVVFLFHSVEEPADMDISSKSPIVTSRKRTLSPSSVTQRTKRRREQRTRALNRISPTIDIGKALQDNFTKF